MTSEIKSTGGDPHVFQSHHFNKAAFQGSSLFQGLKCGTREFVWYTQTVSSNINKDGRVDCSHEAQKAQTNSLNFKYKLYR